MISQKIKELDYKGKLNSLPDSIYIRLKYYAVFGRLPNLHNPKRFSEKLQWLKLHDRKELYTKLSDKYEAKKIVGKKIGKEHIIPTIGVYDNFDKIDINKLPNKFVMKCTHDSGGVIVCKDKKKLNWEDAKQLINNNLKSNFYIVSREWPYKNIKPRIIIEEYIGSDLTDYRFYCFHGKVEYIYEYTNKGTKDNHKPEPTHCNVYDRNWKQQKFRNNSGPTEEPTKKPKKLKEMIEIAEKLSKGLKFIRVDLYNIGEKIYFGELTFYPGAGWSIFHPDTYDYKLGRLLKIKESKSRKSLIKKRDRVLLKAKVPVMSELVGKGIEYIYKPGCVGSGEGWKYWRNFGKWTRSIKNYKVVVLSENYYNYDVSRYIKQVNPDCKVILFFWNKLVFDSYFKVIEDPNLDEIYTFDEEEAEKYHFKHNSTYYSKKVKLPKNNIENDVVFLGRAKDREKDIRDLEKKLRKKKIKTDFKIITDEKDIIGYKDYLEMVSKAKCLLDFNAYNQRGLALRVMEGLFFKKKVITTNKYVKEYDFYNKNNFFIIGEDDWKEIKNFINSDYEEVDQKIIDYYDFEQWIKRFK